MSLLIDGKSPGVLRLQILSVCENSPGFWGAEYIHPNTNEIGQEMPQDKIHKKMKMGMGVHTYNLRYSGRRIAG